MDLPHENDELAGVVYRNIDQILEVRRKFEERRTAQQRFADFVTNFAGSMASVLFHAVVFGLWIAINSGAVPIIKPFDPFPFVMLAMFASVEAIFLSTFVLISQNRMSQISEKRADLDLQVNLLSEHELTRLIGVVDQIARKLGLPSAPGVDELKKDVSPERVLEEIEEAEDQKKTDT
ncbi:MAG TPA: DUF1003 domain-containing protein [Bdellovibrionota bacterium]|nr:DUF1003 domain-containing protein [Bdellovibrionota bacterium]